jgi:hypothetical protein
MIKGTDPRSDALASCAAQLGLPQPAPSPANGTATASLRHRLPVFLQGQQRPAPPAAAQARGGCFHIRNPKNETPFSGGGELPAIGDMGRELWRTGVGFGAAEKLVPWGRGAGVAVAWVVP